mmetsp:Transcript_6771/g.16610  ORF Transcript_6771/g.16610 Transcript_6771/m.16610 type:complete len:232 (-) Transcript_6771:829-1524(-)|eukprot:CAMPEP_0114506414 /NCGR_PEP_ID=MMETSP0109-20121206/11413_1 /TAXON_ID=29199 /ORGANISM="Chlorarachnion reptans, Strain CCCM449" /LENGTH=231 /DNA_ID=CAMNT_0001684997 /DNA_START=448 /DNA_END=1143 /DNA_ORIENTATION=+
MLWIPRRATSNLFRREIIIDLDSPSLDTTKAKLHGQEGIPPDQQRLVFKGDSLGTCSTTDSEKRDDDSPSSSGSAPKKNRKPSLVIIASKNEGNCLSFIQKAEKVIKKEGKKKESEAASHRSSKSNRPERSSGDQRGGAQASKNNNVDAPCTPPNERAKNGARAGRNGKGSGRHDEDDEKHAPPKGQRKPVFKTFVPFGGEQVVLEEDRGSHIVKSDDGMCSARCDICVIA